MSKCAGLSRASTEGFGMRPAPDCSKLRSGFGKHEETFKEGGFTIGGSTRLGGACIHIGLLVPRFLGTSGISGG